MHHKQKTVFYDRSAVETSKNRAVDDVSIDAYFTDNGISGNEADRPGLRSMLDYLMAHQDPDHQNVVLVRDISRLARDVSVYRYLQGEISKLGARIVTLPQSGELES